MSIVSTINYEGDNKTVVWKHPMVDFNNNTTLIVHENQEAIFYLNGEALDSFGPGKHLLETGKIPILSEKLFGKIVDGEIFHSEVYFVNKVEQMSINWGTNPRIHYIDKTAENYQFDLGVFGKMSVKVTEPRRLVQNIVGAEDALGQERLISYFRPMLMQNMRSYVSKELNEQSISIFELDNHTKELSDGVKQLFNEEIQNYGLTIVGFWIEGFDFPENDEVYREIKSLRGKKVTMIQGQKLDQEIRRNELDFNKDYEKERAELEAQKEIIAAEAERQKTILEAQGKATGRKLEGITKQEELGYDVASKLAQNEGLGNFSNAGIGLGMMAGVGGGMGAAVANITTQAIAPVVNGGTSHQMSDGIGEVDGIMPEDIELTPIEDKPKNGTEIKDDLVAQLERLKKLMDDGLLSQDEFAVAKAKLLGNHN